MLEKERALCGTEKSLGGKAWRNLLTLKEEFLSRFNLFPGGIEEFQKEYRYLDFRWQAIKMYQEQQELIITLLEKILSLEGGKER
jgi:hypothetical protein